MDAAEFVPAIESNRFELYRMVATAAQRPLPIDPFLSWVNCAPSRWPFTIFAADFGVADAGERIRFVKDRIRKGIAPNSWSIGPSTRPENLEMLLVREGFKKGWDSAGMGMELSALKSDAEPPPGWKIETVSDDRTRLDWARVVAVGLFGCAESEVENFHELMISLKPCDGLALFLVRYEGEPASSATLWFRDGIAGICHVATLPEFRRRGFGSSITRAPLLRAQTLGARTAIPQATALGGPVYRRLGFRTYCTPRRYRPED